MDNEKTEKKPGIFGKIGAFWKSGVKGKVICIASVLVILGIIGALTDDGEGGGKKFKVNAPVKSLCGFEIGATPSSVKHLFQNNSIEDGGWYIEGKLPKPFRHYYVANVQFTKDPITGAGSYLYREYLHLPYSWNSEHEEIRNWDEADRIEEGSTIAAMLEKKWGIKFAQDSNEHGNPRWVWKTEGSVDCAQQSITIDTVRGMDLDVTFESALYSIKDEVALREKQRRASKLSADSGGDQL